MPLLVSILGDLVSPILYSVTSLEMVSLIPVTHSMNKNPACQQAVTVKLKDGLHLRPQSQIVELAQKFDCEVNIRKDDQTVDAKSMFDLMTLAATCGTTLYLEASGNDAAEAVRQLVQLFQSNFEGTNSEDL